MRKLLRIPAMILCAAMLFFACAFCAACSAGGANDRPPAQETEDGKDDETPSQPSENPSDDSTNQPGKEWSGDHKM